MGMVLQKVIWNLAAGPRCHKNMEPRAVIGPFVYALTVNEPVAWLWVALSGALYSGFTACVAQNVGMFISYRRPSP